MEYHIWNPVTQRMWCGVLYDEATVQHAYPHVEFAYRRKDVCVACFLATINDGTDDSLSDFFAKHHLQAPHVYAAFVAMSEEIMRAGHKRYGAKTIMERLRWESAARYPGHENDFKLANNIKDRCTARYVRMAIAENNKFADFFETRKLTASCRRTKAGAQEDYAKF